MRCSAAILFSLIVLQTLGTSVAHAEPAEVISMKLHAKSVPAFGDSIRLLPKESELKPGNAAVVLLRMPWEQTAFMKKIVPKIDDLTELNYDDRAIDEVTNRVSEFVRHMKRAAYLRDADWNYPIGEEPLAEVLLPDAQGMRTFIGRIMYLWVGKQIALGNLDEAREGILVQFACGRHICRTPFAVCNLVGQAVARMGLQRLEILVQQPQAENYYYALANLPDSLGDIEAVFAMEASMFAGSLPSLPATVPPVSDPRWQKVANELFTLATQQLVRSKKLPDDAELRAKFLEIAATELPKYKRFSSDQIMAMSNDEKIVRWVLAHHEESHSHARFALSLPNPQGIVILAELEQENQALLKRIGTPVDLIGPLKPIAFVALQRFDRRVKLLQVVEAIRDHASRNSNRLPETLDEIDLPIPRDPLTEKPFTYVLEVEKATLSYPTIAGVDDKVQDLTRYELELVESE